MVSFGVSIVSLVSFRPFGGFVSVFRVLVHGTKIIVVKRLQCLWFNYIIRSCHEVQR